MAFRTFLKLDRLTGEGGIEVLSFHFGAATDHTHAGGGGGGAGKQEALPLVIMKQLDNTTPGFYMGAAVMDGHKDGTLYCSQENSAGGLMAPFLKIKLFDVFIMRDEVRGSEQGESRPLEEVTLKYQGIDIWADGAERGIQFPG